MPDAVKADVTRILGEETPPDLVVLGLALPAPDALRVLALLRERDDVPVLLFSARRAEVDRGGGTGVGVDDRATTPVGPLELLDRVVTVPRRRAGVAEHGMPGSIRDRIRFGDVEVVTNTQTVYRRGDPVELRPKEYELFMSLVRRQGEVVSRFELLRDVWGYCADVVSRTVDTHVAALRRKIEDDPSDPRHILTVRKTGYRLRLD